MLSAILIIFTVLFFVFVGGAFIVGWRSFKDSNILGGVILMWVILAIFLLFAFFFGGGN